MYTGLTHAAVILASSLPTNSNSAAAFGLMIFQTFLTLMPSKRDRALRGRRARSVLRDLMAVSSE